MFDMFVCFSYHVIGKLLVDPWLPIESMPWNRDCMEYGFPLLRIAPFTTRHSHLRYLTCSLSILSGQRKPVDVSENATPQNPHGFTLW